MPNQLLCSGTVVCNAFCFRMYWWVRDYNQYLIQTPFSDLKLYFMISLRPLGSYLILIIKSAVIRYATQEGDKGRGVGK